ncbi:MAG: hypothetical protein NXI32_24220 [bacterium]|nr:hypothetical protein [bacterium]
MFKIIKLFLLTIAGALLVSLLKDRPEILAGILLCVLGVHLFIVWRRRRNPWVVAEECFYLITFGVLGYLTEAWGTTHGHWTYGFLPAGHSVPYWVPVAWSIAAMLLGKAESYVERSTWHGSRHPALFRIGCIYLLGMAMPLTGESICIAFGVWEYHWPLKILGVPLLALILISYAHLVFSLVRAGGAAWRERQATLET